MLYILWNLAYLNSMGYVKCLDVMFLILAYYTRPQSIQQNGSSFNKLTVLLKHQKLQYSQGRLYLTFILFFFYLFNLERVSFHECTYCDTWGGQWGLL